MRASSGRSFSARLTLEDELRLTREVEEAEVRMASAVVRAPAALSELARIGDDVRCGAVRPRDVRRTVEHAPAAVTASRARLLDVLARAGRLAAAVRAANGGKGTRQELREQQTARRRLAVEIASLRLRQSVLDQVAAAMGVDDGGAAARLAFARARGASCRAKSEWTAASAYLVLAIAKRYRRPGVDTVDLVQDGSIGLIRAVEKFDASLGYRFHAYAAWWIRQHIFRALADYGRSIRVPMPMVEASQRVGRVRRVFEGVHGREPSDAEIAAVSGLDVGTVAAVDAIIDEPMSLQGRIGDQELDLLDRLTDRSAPLPDEQVAQARLQDRIHGLFDELAPREKDVLRLRYGLEGNQDHTLAETAALLRISRERARRIEERALSKLRAWSTRSGLRGYLAA
jgi:RNA polymerase primary sigma factor